MQPSDAEPSQSKPPFHEHGENQPQDSSDAVQPSLTFNPPPPPVPYQQFEYSFPPAFPELVLPPGHNSATQDLFSASEQDNLFGFLDKFEWQFDPLLPSGIPSLNTGQLSGADSSQSLRSAPLTSQNDNALSNVHAGATPRAHSPANSLHPPRAQLSSPVYASRQSYSNPALVHFSPSNPHPSSNVPPIPDNSYSDPLGSRDEQTPLAALPLKQETQESGVNLAHDGLEAGQQGVGLLPSLDSGGERVNSTPAHSANGRPQKPVLSTPEKRVRHILSEQRRRNTIRDGYAALTNMLVPYPSAVSRPAPHGHRVEREREREEGRGERGKAECCSALLSTLNGWTSAWRT
ncbi:uncharacterized protein EI90DRAFT_1952734 [Cantharellus anzutake]|uniref:uncharacterized protein n=1 Tax=Cantharellus anzutake TaxID=1750568 RepID=UPI001907C64E|nr:uncharacterized protein EI90DRAFT_1952734 [Cantharellus anzutake]KAF8326400.1 hypothetical protein EI90DRAFT_1952734 [Cantharellus anzutake]